MGVVLRARHVAVRLPVAIKVVEGASVEAFATDVRAVAGLRHPNVVLVFDHGVVPISACSVLIFAMVTHAGFLE
jgi:hypothetical protein